MSKKVKITILIVASAAIVVAAFVYSLVTYFQYEAYRKAAEAALQLVALL